jgi:glycosyltransferase involved in cell wall biosynthesis
MKIVQLLPELNEGGVERGTMELSRELVKLGHESIVISAGGKLQEQIEKDGGRHITFDVCSKNPLTAPFRMIQLRKILRTLGPDILHARSRVPAWLTYLANKKLHIPFVTTVHGFNSVSPYSAVMTEGDRVICVSGAIKTYIQEHYYTADEKITVIPRGIDLERFNPRNLDAEFIRLFIEEHSLEEKFIVTSVGRITQLKDLETFISAIAVLKQNHPNVVGLIVGGVREDKQEYFHSLKTLVKKLDLESHIIFTGSQSKVAEIYALSNVVVSSSKKPESFGRSVAEALALGTPVVATGHGGVLDIIVEGENGFFYPVGESGVLAEKVLKSKELKFEGYNYIANNFSLKNMVEKTIEVYEGLLKV